MLCNVLILSTLVYLVSAQDPQTTCQSNETLYLCNTALCCRGHSELLVNQLAAIKTRFQGVDDTLNHDFSRIQAYIVTEVLRIQNLTHRKLGTKYSILGGVFNSTLSHLQTLFSGEGDILELKNIVYNLGAQILRKTFSASDVPPDRFPRTIDGIGIFWQINDAQRQCVIGEFLNQSTEFGAVVFNFSDSIHEVSQSVHEYMSSLGSMVKIVQTMVSAQETSGCLHQIVKMQECSLCTQRPVCSPFYHQLLSSCVPQLLNLNERWDAWMEAMGVLTLRLCDHSLVNILQPLTGIVEFITSGNLDRVIYQHGVMSFMRCVQPDGHKRSTSHKYVYGASSDPFTVEDKFSVDLRRSPHKDTRPVVLSDQSDVQEVHLLRRSITEHPTNATTTTSSTPEDRLSTCRVQLGLNFPPPDVGSPIWLNISVSYVNSDCWNGTGVGTYTVEKPTAYAQAQEIKDLDEKLCKYTRGSETCLPPLTTPPINYSYSMDRALASFIATFLFCCC